MSARRKDTVILVVVAALTSACMWYFYTGMDERKSISDVNPYTLVVPGPEAVLAINRPLVFEKVILPKKDIREVFSKQIPGVYADLIRDNPDLPLFLFSFYAQDLLFYAPMDGSEARQVFKQLEARSPFKDQRKTASLIDCRYYPETGKRFFGCYYHEGMFVASYSRKLLEQVARRQQTDSGRVIPGLKEVLETTNTNTPVNLFVPSDSLNLYVQITDITEWRIKDQWLGMNIFPSDNKLCCFHTQPYQPSLDSLFYQAGFSTLYQSMGDTMQARINKLFPQIKTTAQVSHDEAVAYFTICGQ